MLILVAFTRDKKFNIAVTQKNETVDADRFVNFVHSTGERWGRLTRDPVKLTDLWWQHDNARHHSSRTTKEFFDRRGVTMIWQPPYSPDMNLADRFLFKLLKKELRKDTFSTAEEVQEASLRILRAIPEETFAAQLAELREHCQHVIDKDGHYVTK